MTTAQELRRIMSAIKRVLKRREHLHLLKPSWRRMHEEHRIPASTGFCSIAAEALYHLAGGQGSGLKPYRRSYRDGTTHWWLVDEKGRVWDPTADQFESASCFIGYEEGRAGGFPTPKQGKRMQPPSKRAAELMAAVLEELQGR
jgi:hypothetical protein